MNHSANPGKTIRRSNRAAILNLLYRRGSQLRSDIANRLGLTGAAVSRITRELINAGIVEQALPEKKTGVLGRRSAILRICEQGAYVLALTLTANRKSAAIFDASGGMVGLTELARDIDSSPIDSVEALIAAAHRLVCEHNIDRGRVIGVGVGIAMQPEAPGRENRLVSSRYLGWNGVPLYQLLSERLPYPVAIEARASALLRAETSRTNALSDQDLYLINVGLGIGTAGRIAGNMLSSAKPGFGSISHLTHPSSRSPCDCGRSGCLEYCAAGAAVILDSMTSRISRPIKFASMGSLLGEAIQRAEAGNQTVQDAFFGAGRKLAFGVDTAFSLIQPDKIILAGQAGRQPDFIAGLKYGLEERHSNIEKQQLIISRATSAEASAAIALDAFVYSENLKLEQLNVSYGELEQTH